MAANPWAEHAGRESHASKGKGKGKGHPPVPEPAATGALLVGAALLLVLVARWKARRIAQAVKLET